MVGVIQILRNRSDDDDDESYTRMQVLLVLPLSRVKGL